MYILNLKLDNAINKCILVSMYIEQIPTKTSTGKISHICTLLRESYRVTEGADRIKVLTLVSEESKLDRIIHLREITPLYFPLLSTTAKTGSVSFLKSDKQEESVSFSLTSKNPCEKTSCTILTIEKPFSTNILMERFKH